jgi:anaerobic magnesium-protoporphyrin IX monomethyl ester cyclase
MWKINCRPDEIDTTIFTLMKSNGLFLVFIGIEDGTDSGLKRINKHMTVERCLAGINILKKLDIGFDFGFMLFQPSTTFRSLNQNLEFLTTICRDGFSSVNFLKMMPYYKSDIEKELLAEGRLKGKPGYRDYDFTEDPMNHYYEFFTQCFSDWTRQPDGVANISKWARNHISVCNKYFGSLPLLQEISNDFINVISESNVFFLETMRELIPCFESGNYVANEYKNLYHYREEIKEKHDLYKTQIRDTIKKLSLLVELLQYIKPHYIDPEFVKSAY